ncbi:hypothetical protein PGT21_033743 [Puccinia graminis f. sp. tritici]|uniref:Uncharacterized protein n=1 Tax=Puccinia graminis f. sp. tritici TaxID=56615 RepID=A0A5B0PZI2_PUCGR|nr:hypothetical protein PGT21_033743 [Puccinia graminis f. sp. tritici]
MAYHCPRNFKMIADVDRISSTSDWKDVWLTPATAQKPASLRGPPFRLVVCSVYFLPRICFRGLRLNQTMISVSFRSHHEPGYYGQFKHHVETIKPGASPISKAS